MGSWKWHEHDVVSVGSRHHLPGCEQLDEPSDIVGAEADATSDAHWRKEAGREDPGVEGGSGNAETACCLLGGHQKLFGAGHWSSPSCRPGGARRRSSPRPEPISSSEPRGRLPHNGFSLAGGSGWWSARGNDSSDTVLGRIPACRSRCLMAEQQRSRSERSLNRPAGDVDLVGEPAGSRAPAQPVAVRRQGPPQDQAGGLERLAALDDAAGLAESVEEFVGRRDDQVVAADQVKEFVANLVKRRCRFVGVGAAAAGRRWRLRRSRS